MVVDACLIRVFWGEDAVVDDKLTPDNEWDAGFEVIFPAEEKLCLLLSRES